jgi:hypothetical protein
MQVTQKVQRAFDCRILALKIYHDEEADSCRASQDHRDKCQTKIKYSIGTTKNAACLPQLTIY